MVPFDESIEVREDSNTRENQPEMKAVGDETHAAVLQAMESLPENYRLPVLLRYSEHYSYQEIAEKLSLPVSTVETRLFRGKKILQKKLAAYAGGRGEK